VPVQESSEVNPQKDCGQPDARDTFAVKTNIAVSSTEFFQCSFDEGDVREGLGGSSRHGVMIPLHQEISFAAILFSNLTLHW
jgi:hypothetical protein